MKHILLMITLTLSFGALANKVDGGFGFKFKEKIDISKFELIKKTKTEGDGYKFSPLKPYGNLKDYSIYVTPTTNKIYKIEAKGYFNSKKDCKQELLALGGALEGKYGKKNSDLSAAMSNMPIIRLGGNGKRIVAVCMVYMKPYELTLSYMDDKQTKVAEQERALIINNQRDLTGL